MEEPEDFLLQRGRVPQLHCNVTPLPEPSHVSGHANDWNPIKHAVVMAMSISREMSDRMHGCAIIRSILKLQTHVDGEECIERVWKWAMRLQDRSHTVYRQKQSDQELNELCAGSVDHR